MVFWNVSDQEDNSRELKITVRFLSNEVRADGIKIIVHEKTCLKVNTDCKIQKIESEISNQVKLAILKKAAIYKKRMIKQNLIKLKNLEKVQRQKKRRTES